MKNRCNLGIRLPFSQHFQFLWCSITPFHFQHVWCFFLVCGLSCSFATLFWCYLPSANFLCITSYDRKLSVEAEAFSHGHCVATALRDSNCLTTKKHDFIVWLYLSAPQLNLYKAFLETPEIRKVSSFNHLFKCKKKGRWDLDCAGLRLHTQSHAFIQNRNMVVKNRQRSNASYY